MKTPTMECRATADLHITINTKKPTPWNYGFLGVIKMTKKPTPSKFDIEEFNGKEFPFKD